MSINKSNEYYNCIPELNKKCKKNNCYLSGGYCYKTKNLLYSSENVINTITELTNIIRKAKNNLIKDIAMMKTVGSNMEYFEVIQRLSETVKILDCMKDGELNGYICIRKK